MKKSKSTMREYQRRIKQFVHDAQGAFDCQLILAEDLLYIASAGFPVTMADAFKQWSTTTVKSKPGDGSLCLTCDVEFGPGRAVPAAFWLQSPFAKRSPVTVISGICPACFARADCVDRILAGMRQRIPDLQIMPATRQ
jgi:hypothetical protein